MDRSKWEYKKLSDVSKIIMGQSPSSSSYNEEGDGLPFYQGNADFGEMYPTARVFCNAPSREAFTNDILMSVRAPIGAINIAKEHCSIGRGLCAISPLPNVSEKMFLFYFLKAKNSLLNSQGTGSTFKSINKQVIFDLSIKIPSFEDQQRIVAELDCLNEMIAVKQEQLKEFDKLAQSIFYDMFESIDKYVPASHYIESLGGGKSLAGEEECINKVLKTGAVTYDYFKEDEVKNLPQDYEPMKDHLLKDGDLLVSRMNTLEYVGAIAYVWKAPQNTYLPDRLWRAKLKSRANPVYLWFSLKQGKAKEQIRAKASGTSGSMKNISMPKFLSTTIKEAPLSLQQQFADKISAIEAQKELVKQIIAETQQLLDYTMEKYFGYD